MNYRTLIFVLLLLIGDWVKADPNTFEVDTVTLNNTFVTTAFTTVTFATPFATTPLVFTVPTQQGSDACAIRIQNVTTDDFEAACVESDSFDGEHAAMDMHYIAITPGQHDIDISGGGTVSFEAGSVDTQRVQHNCASGCATASYETVSFTAALFSSAPVVLAQVQTMENEANNPPGDTSEPFLATAIRTGSITSSQFELALERAEENDGSITDDETIAWLAVEETSGCTTLDFSSIGGPSSIAFEAIITDDDIDGWDNGCDAGEDASFSAGCFSSNPLVVATQRTRDGNNGGWVRRCSLSTSAARFTIDEDTNRDTERSHTSERVSVLAFGSAFTTPVSLSYIKFRKNFRKLSVDWQTATETFNLGFHFWGKLNGEWVQLNKRLFRSKEADSLRPQRYKHNIKLTREENDLITEFGISTIDTAGSEEFYGPFENRETYGELSIPEPIDWNAIRKEYEQTLRARGYELWEGRWLSKKQKKKKRKILSKLRKAQNQEFAYDSDVANLIIDKAGVYRIDYQQLYDFGFDLNAVPVKKIAVTYNNKAVPRFIHTNGKRFGPDSYIDFYASLPQGEEALYRKDNVYQIKIDKHKAVPVSEIASQLEPLRTEDDYLKTYHEGENKSYGVSSAGDDPWLDDNLFAFSSAVSKTYEFNLPSTANFTRAGQLKVSLYGGLNLPGDVSLEPDHHVQIWVNQTKVLDEYADGFNDWQLQTELAANLLKAGINIVEIRLPADTGKLYDLVYINDLELSVFEPLVANQDITDFSAQQNATDYYATGFSNSDLVVYAYQENGNLRKLIGNQPQQLADDSWALNLLAIDTQNELNNLRYWVASSEQMLSPKGIYLSSPENLAQDVASYLIIAHPVFIGSELEQFAQTKTHQGIPAQIVNLSDIIDVYGYGNKGPQAIKRFLKAANEFYNYDYVLLVGGNSYDYHDYTGQGSVDFIPAYYRAVQDFAYAPTDTPYIDLNDDGLPDKAIGRWPVRTKDDLALIIQKTNDWIENGMYTDRSALLIAEQYDGKGHNFAKQLDSLQSWLFTPAPKPQKGGVLWSEVNKVYLDDVIASGVSNPIGESRNQIQQHINSGVALTIFDGHGSPSSWTFQGLMTWDNLSQLDNAGLPTMVMPLACYTTFYETPTVDTLAHQWLFSGNKGAAAIHGAAVYSGFRANSQIAKRILTHQFKEGKSVGQAILEAKRELLPGNELITNWVLLGDPSMVLEP